MHPVLCEQYVESLFRTRSRTLWKQTPAVPVLIPWAALTMHTIHPYFPQLQEIRLIYAWFIHINPIAIKLSGAGEIFGSPIGNRRLLLVTYRIIPQIFTVSTHSYFKVP